MFCPHPVMASQASAYMPNTGLYLVGHVLVPASRLQSSHKHASWYICSTLRLSNIKIALLGNTVIALMNPHTYFSCCGQLDLARRSRGLTVPPPLVLPEAHMAITLSRLFQQTFC